MASGKKIKIPKSVLELRNSPKKFAKKHNIKLNGKGVSKSDKKRNLKRFKKEYSEFAISSLNKATKILAEYPENKKSEKVKEGVENIIKNPEVMKRIIKIYKKESDNYQNLIFLPNMIMNTLLYYSNESLSDEEKEVAKDLNSDELIKFCEKILKKQIKRYKNKGLSDAVAYQLATVAPTTKLFQSDRMWYRRLIRQMYDIAEHEEINFAQVIKAVMSIDKKKKYIKKKDFLNGFFSEFILQKYTNKQAKFTDSQKDFHNALIEEALTYLDTIKKSETKDILKNYIKRRKKAEENKNDSKRIIKFIDHANSNSPYTRIKEVVQDLIEADKNNEIYLS